ncbi:hypothetical protein H0H87_006078 [Tephrocybe sp. NHM501043]|nr:hypothetical protein H0H87_006078 [Tephrocybe sp. NHM501043]
MSTRRVVVDDSDPRITYLGSAWFTTARRDKDFGHMGPTYLGSQHGISDTGNLTFDFEGSTVELYGTNGQVASGTDFDPRWSCFVDGKDIGVPSGSSDPENNWLLCASDSLGPGIHTLEVNVFGRGEGSFWFDKLMYTPAANRIAAAAVTWIDVIDPGFRYSQGWQLADTMTTAFKGATVSLSFFGAST